jgi:DNA-binding response OmpR family regulator
MPDRVALIVHSDPSLRRMLSDALSMFSPGYRVTTASNFDRATEWLDVLDPDLVVVEGGTNDPSALSTWAAAHQLEPPRLLLLMAPNASPSIPGAAIVKDPLDLPELMGEVRRMASARSSAATMQSSDQWTMIEGNQ